ncbi:MAG: hypothetical protein DRP85_06115 [Candidatus Makaraimicrobium thalassicum]|nr:MAG: hypothetical protein DRP85_06115 [Candidatus Omnitrophota bacterium]
MVNAGRVMRVLILSGREVRYKGEAYQAVLPGLDGEFSVLDFHQPFLYRLRKGIVKIKATEKGRESKVFPLKDGLAGFKGNSLLILS